MKGGPARECHRFVHEVGIEQQEAGAQLTLYSYNPSESAMPNAATKAKQLQCE